MAGLAVDGIPSTQIDSSNFSGTNVYASTGSFVTVVSTTGSLTNIILGGSIIAGRLNDGNGAIFSADVGSPATFGAIVQAGTAGQLLAATGSIVFGRQFSNSSFIVTITPQTSGTLYPYIVSGTTTYTISGVTYGGQSGLAYNWIAIGV